MKTFLFLSLVVFAFVNAEATTIAPRELAELVEESDHIIIATVTKVDMIDKNGKELTKPS